jgi:hypothetical protein
MSASYDPEAHRVKPLHQKTPLNDEKFGQKFEFQQRRDSDSTAHINKPQQPLLTPENLSKENNHNKLQRLPTFMT